MGQGVTLVELMVTIALLAILATLALPAYRNVIQRHHRRQALDALYAIYTGERAYHLVHNSYYGPLHCSPGDCSPNEEWAKIHMSIPTTGLVPFTYEVSVSPGDGGGGP